MHIILENVDMLSITVKTDSGTAVIEPNEALHINADCDGEIRFTLMH